MEVSHLGKHFLCQHGRLIVSDLHRPWPHMSVCLCSSLLGITRTYAYEMRVVPVLFIRWSPLNSALYLWGT